MYRDKSSRFSKREIFRTRSISYLHKRKKLSKECLVRAQIKLTLKTFDGKPVTIIRSFQVSQKAKTRRYQQIDATIRSINEEGERVTATHKCLEIDNIAARIMKVSKAILSNVIFCHQEESLWPMGDSKSLKLKFDDIFSSTKYTKALQKIKTVRKNLKTKTAFLEKDLLLAKNNLQSYKKYKNDLENLTKEIVILNETSSKLSKDINVEENNLERLEENVESVKETQNEIERLNFRISALLKEKKILELSIIEILDKSDEDIKNDLDICLKQSKVLVAKLGFHFEIFRKI
ncbi:DNA repair protein rad50, variant 4 [Bonamia ostreae]|uniref:DNA repair protein rad50, variant 4 n=1 Tax=Bonamia ostreae TaxID=126728 RepID=A0ABV2AP61_9EUKA